VTVVSNSSPLVYLAALSDFELLPKLFGTILTPLAVWREVVEQAPGLPVRAAVEGALGHWMNVVPLTASPSLTTLPRGVLHAGEAEVIQLAREVGANAVLIDDRIAVEHARSLGFTVVPTVALYIRAKHLGLIPSVREKADQLRRARFRLSDADYQAVLRAAGELQRPPRSGPP